MPIYLSIGTSDHVLRYWPLHGTGYASTRWTVEVYLVPRLQNKEQDKIRLACFGRLKDIHIRRAKLLGLDAPTKLDVTGIYRRGGDEITAEQRAREAVIQLPIEEQRRIYDLFYEAGKRAAAGDFSQPAIETTVTSGPDNRNGVEPADDADHSDT